MSLASLRPIFRPAIRSALFHRTFSTTPSLGLTRITIIGRLAGTPEVSNANGTDIIRYAIATSHGSRDHRQTSWWRVTAFIKEGPIRDMVLNLSKGSRIYVEGEPSINKYLDKDGNQQSSLKIIQRHIYIVERRGEGEANAVVEGGPEGEADAAMEGAPEGETP